MPNNAQKEKKKVLYIITKSVWAGAGKYVYDLATGLPGDRFEASAAAGGRGELARKLEEAKIPYYEIKHFQRDVSLLGDVFSFFEILSLLFRTHPDVVHVSSSKASGLGGVAIFIYRIFFRLSLQPTCYKLQAIFTAHGWAFAEKRNALQIKLIKLASKITCIFYNKIICVSEFDRQIALKNKIAPAKKLVTIHNGIKIDEYEFLTKEKARERIKNYDSRIKNEEEIWIGTIGEFTKNKGQAYLIEVAEKLKIKNLKFKIVLIGFGEEYENLKFKIKNLKLEDNVFLLNNLESAPKYLKSFDIFTLPSLKEGLPYTILEAGLARLPVAASNIGGIPEIIENPSAGSGQATGLLVEPENSEDLKNKIEKMIENTELRSNMAHALWEKVHQEFRFEQMLKKTVSAYENDSQPGDKNNA